MQWTPDQLESLYREANRHNLECPECPTCGRQLRVTPSRQIGIPQPDRISYIMTDLQPRQTLRRAPTARWERPGTE